MAKSLWFPLILALAFLTSLSVYLAMAYGVSDQHQGVPAYFYPTTEGTAVWEYMCDTATTYEEGSFVILNQDSGNPTGFDSSYDYVRGYCRDAGQNVLAYVPTNYTNTHIDTVKARIDAYRTYYGTNAFDGYFLDEVTNDPDATGASDGYLAQEYYQELHSYINAFGSCCNISVGNPGAPASTDWQIDTDAFDHVVVYENTDDSYLGASLPGWVAGELEEDVWVIIHSTATTDAMEDVYAKAKSDGIGVVYVTPDVPGNPYNNLADTDGSTADVPNDGTYGMDFWDAQLIQADAAP